MADAFARSKKGRTGHTEGTEDRVVEGVLHGWTLAQHNMRAVLLGVGALAVVVAGGLYWISYTRSVEERAALELQALRGASAIEEPLTLATQLESYIGRFDGTSGADEARVILARIHLDFDQTGQAIETLQSADQSLDTPLGVATRAMLATAYARNGETDQAIAILETLAAGAPFGFQQREALATKGRLLAADGRLAEAEAVYASLVEDTEDVVEQSAYRVRLGEVRALQSAGSRGTSTAPTPLIAGLGAVPAPEGASVPPIADSAAESADPQPDDSSEDSTGSDGG